MNVQEGSLRHAQLTRCYSNDLDSSFFSTISVFLFVARSFQLAQNSQQEQEMCTEALSICHLISMAAFNFLWGDI